MYLPEIRFAVFLYFADPFFCFLPSSLGCAGATPAHSGSPRLKIFCGVLRALLFAMVGRPSHRPCLTYGSLEQGELERLRAAADEMKQLFPPGAQHPLPT